MNTLNRRIHERAIGWEVTSETCSLGFWPTGAAALEAIKAESAARVERTGESEAVVVEWEPMSWIGRLVARTLAAT